MGQTSYRFSHSVPIRLHWTSVILTLVVAIMATVSCKSDDGCTARGLCEGSSDLSSANLLQGKRLPSSARAVIFTCGCDRCRKALKAVAGWRRDRGAKPQISVVTDDPVAAKKLCQSLGLEAQIIDDADHHLAEHYDALFCPKAFLLDAKGNITRKSAAAASATDVIQLLAGDPLGLTDGN
jgi:hypothetical protein